MATKLEISRDGGKSWEEIGTITDMKWAADMDFRPEELGSPETEPQCMTCYDRKKVIGPNAGDFVRDCPDCCGEEG